MSAIDPNDLDGVLGVFREAAVGAAAIAMQYFKPGGRTSAKIEYKDGGSPVSDADYAADAYLKKTLCAAIPAAAWLSEETADDRVRLGRRHVIVVDPIDGTRGFVAGDARWAVCIALVTDGRPRVGIVHAPVLDQSFTGIVHHGAWCNGSRIVASSRRDLRDGTVAMPGQLPRHVAWPSTFRIAPRIPSLACRLVHVAAGFLDACVSAPNANDWDIAAADVILHEAGAILSDRHGSLPLYNRRLTTHPLLIAGPPALHRALVGLMQRSND